MSSTRPAAREGGDEPRVVAFLCHWCAYAAADAAGSQQRPLPAGLRVLRVPCSGRVDPAWVLTALSGGADGVIVGTCHPADCHYASGSRIARARFLLLQRVLEAAGIAPARLRLAAIGAGEPQRFRQVVEETAAALRRLRVRARIT